MKSSPPPKRLCKDAGAASSLTKHRTVDEDETNPEADITLEPVLADSVTRVLPVEWALVARLSDKKRTTAVVGWLAAHLPVPALGHLKRVKTVCLNGSPSLFVIVDLLELVFPSLAADGGRLEVPDAEPAAPSALGDGVSVRELAAVLCGRGLPPLPDGLCAQLYRAPVAAARPATRRQYQQSAVLWPTAFHRDLRLEASLAAPAASAAERRRLAGWMAAAVRAALRSDGTARVGCVIVDPASDRLVATAADARGRHALQHAVMRAVDVVAAGQGGGAWERSEALEPPPEPDGGPPPYLCTGYEAFVTREPCLMCAMALLHSRISRVFYGIKQPQGALGSLCKLHVTDGLNHRFEVFAGLCAELCRGLQGAEAGS